MIACGSEFLLIESTVEHHLLDCLEFLRIVNDESKEGGLSSAIQPVVPFGKIELHSNYLLLEDEDIESTPASAG